MAPEGVIALTLTLAGGTAWTALAQQELPTVAVYKSPTCGCCSKWIEHMQAAVGNGWRSFAGDENNWGTIPQPGAPGSENIVNRPDPTDTYSVPQNLGYSVNGVERKRTNGQLTLQYAPTDTLTTTLDYTYSENKIATQRNELSVWFNFGPSSSVWTDGPVASPLIYSETISPATSDLSMGGAKFATRNENNSVGFNVEWAATDNFGLTFDFHDSSAESGADSPYGSNAVLGVAGFFRGTTTADFSRDFPVMSVELPPGQTGIDASQMLVTGSSFRNSYMKSEIQQAQLSGHLDFFEDSRLDFGVALTDAKNRSAYSNVQADTWGGATSAADYPDSVWRADTVRQYFDNISGSGNPALFNSFFTFDFETVRALAAQALDNEALYRASPVFTTDRRAEEESQSAFVQYSQRWEWGLPMQGAVGLRYEKTEVTSRALIPVPPVVMTASFAPDFAAYDTASRIARASSLTILRPVTVWPAASRSLRPSSRSGPASRRGHASRDRASSSTCSPPRSRTSATNRWNSPSAPMSPASGQNQRCCRSVASGKSHSRGAAKLPVYSTLKQLPPCTSAALWTNVDDPLRPRTYTSWNTHRIRPSGSANARW